ncbi:hypothetical protein ACFQ1T_01865 [Methylophilus glucosoxydans]|uniref:Lipoprotein n=1 Tax=Methylophilus glucosoxydans TaxID=752553 RepID=A0ABW3GD86_9PROT
MNKITILLLSTLFTACATGNPYKNDDPVDQALKICGLGYQSQAARVYKGAYAYALKEGSAEFEMKMNDYIKSQTTAMFESMQLKGKEELDILQKEIQENRSCVLNLIEKNRPKTRSEFISSCISDLKNRVGDIGNQYPKVKNWSVIESHPQNSENNIVIKAGIDHGGSDSYWQTLTCRIRNNRYDDLVFMDSN